MSKSKPQQIDISGPIEMFLEQYAQAIRDGYEIVHSFYSPASTPMGMMMVTMQLPLMA